MKKLVVMIGLTLTSSSVFANSMQAMLQTQDPFKTLQNAFNSALPAKAQDYPRAADLSSSAAKMKCVDVMVGPEVSDDFKKLFPVYVGQFNYVIPGIPATPANGPLFPGDPGTPDQTVSTLSPVMVYGNGTQVSDQEIASALNGLNMPVVSTSKSGDLQSKITSSQDKTYSLVTTYRKNGGELFFHSVESGSSVSDEGYGYCY